VGYPAPTQANENNTGTRVHEPKRVPQPAGGNREQPAYPGRARDHTGILLPPRGRNPSAAVQRGVFVLPTAAAATVTATARPPARRPARGASIPASRAGKPAGTLNPVPAAPSARAAARAIPSPATWCPPPASPSHQHQPGTLAQRPQRARQLTHTASKGHRPCHAPSPPARNRPAAICAPAPTRAHYGL
jgi:hypothetical protein